MQISGESWIHTFEIELPKGTNIIDIFGCNKDKKTCKMVYELLVEIDQIRQHTEIMINSTLLSIYKLVPERNMHTKGR